jgi:hypothetical protein
LLSFSCPNRNKRFDQLQATARRSSGRATSMFPDVTANCCPGETSFLRRAGDQMQHALPMCMRTPCDRARIAKARFRPASLAPTLLALSVVASAMTVAGCAQNPARHEIKPAARTSGRVHKSFEPRRSAEACTRRPDAALLAPQAAPDCEFKNAGSEAVDSGALARLKLEYERKCYQDAERAVRDRLSRLQASSTCEAGPARRRPSAR